MESSQSDVHLYDQSEADSSCPDLFEEASFLKTLFDFMPCGIIVIDQNRKIRSVNNVLERILGVSQEVALGKHGGQILGCIYAHHEYEEAHDCDSSHFCSDCEARKVALDALSGNQKQKIKAPFQLSIEGKVQDLELLLSAAPFDFRGERFAVVILEDISKLNNFRLPEVKSGFRGMIGRDAKMLDLFETIKKVGRFNYPVLIQGETGTGKELVALAIHNESRRSNKYFVPVNSAALPHGLLESELFGHVKGAFTGAHRDKRGRFQVADGGTIFLDEIGDMPPDLQAKLLRILESGSFEPVGSNKSIKVDVRIISASNKKLEEEVARGRFRMDLYHRLSTLPIHLAPLRERLCDIPLLVDFFLERAVEEMGLNKMSFSNEALAMMSGYSWPGNVRELQNVVRFALVKCQGKVIEPEHFPPALQGQVNKPSGRRRTLDKKSVRSALAETQNVSEAAKKVGVSRATLYRFMKKHMPS
ncbi:MAG: sigma 54-interacting transcriptional regulator [Desulfoferrobacter sp.]